MSVNQAQSKRVDDFNSLKSILPHWDPTVLASIFQANEYSLELSIQTALSMEEDGKTSVASPASTDDNTGSKSPISITKSTDSVTTAATTAQKGPKVEVPSPGNQNVDVTAGAKNDKMYRGAKFELPDEFLRVSYAVIVLSSFVIFSHLIFMHFRFLTSSVA